MGKAKVTTVQYKPQMKHQVCVGRDDQPLWPALGRGLSAAGSGPSGTSAGESEEAAGRCDEGIFLRIGYSKIAAGASISTTILPFNLLKYGTVKLLEIPLSSRLSWKKIGYSDFAALYPIFPYHGERRQRIILLI